ncbi:hypothetical protein F5B18DRAFT_584162 [Nemania serpens]|nr:hypothetical protein F5B18DRAFT_584162 [Nemania serpens]
MFNRPNLFFLLTALFFLSVLQWCSDSIYAHLKLNAAVIVAIHTLRGETRKLKTAIVENQIEVGKRESWESRNRGCSAGAPFNPQFCRKALGHCKYLTLCIKACRNAGMRVSCCVYTPSVPFRPVLFYSALIPMIEPGLNDLIIIGVI